MNNSCEELEKIIINYLSDNGKQVFKIRYVRILKDKLIVILNRIHKSFCLLCLREHESDNGYLTINVLNRKVFYYCYRYNNQYFKDSVLEKNRDPLVDLKYRQLYEITKLYFPNLHENMEAPPPPKKVFIDMSDVYQKYFEEELDELLKQVMKKNKKKNKF